MKYYKAPWGTSLIAISWLTTLLCIGIAIVIAWKSPRNAPWASVLPLAILAGSALYTVRGYTVTHEEILVQRLVWTTSLPLAGLQSARVEPGAMRWSIRLFGNGGLFSFTGIFRNKSLGTYRAYVTDPRRTVVLRFARRTVVISPAAPEEFVQVLPVS